MQILAFQADGGGFRREPAAFLMPNTRWPVRSATRLSERGFSLVELLVTLAVAAVLMVLAVPSFRQLTLSNRLTTTANDIVASINTARMEAIKRNGSVQLCSDSATANATGALGTACGTSAGAVYALSGTDATQVRAAVAGLAPPLQLNGELKALRFRGQGQGYAVDGSSPYSGLVADICTTALEVDNHRIIKMAAGSAIVVTPSSGSCSS